RGPDPLRRYCRRSPKRSESDPGVPWTGPGGRGNLRGRTKFQKPIPKNQIPRTPCRVSVLGSWNLVLGSWNLMLAIEKLSVAYGETLIVLDVDLAVGPGEVVCLMGRNGVGKSTLLKSVMGLLRPKSGRILFEGKDITNASPDKRARAGIGYVPQGREIFPQLTVL